MSAQAATSPNNSQSAASPVIVTKSGNGTVKAVVAIVVLVGGFFAYRSWKKERDKTKAGGRMQDSIPTQQAMALRNAMQGQWNHAGSWFKSDVDTIMKIAAQITDSAAVTNEYKLLYDRSLSDDLTAQLTPAQMSQFDTLLKVRNRPHTEYTFIDRNVNTNVKRGDNVFLEWTGRTSILLFRNSEDYPVKILTRIAKPAKPSTKPFGKVLQVDKINYKSGNVTAMLAWVQIPSGQKYWIRLTDLKK